MILPLILFTAVLAAEDQWLLGSWGAGPAECARDSGIRFEADGTYDEADGEGVWTLAGHRLTVSSTGGDDFGRSEVVHVTVRSAGEMELAWPDGSRVKFNRC